ncbi:MAG: serine acetyltransferase [Bacteroidales bacterium]|nr:serine acetyltransferase [Bacteroidales bacterium]
MRSIKQTNELLERLMAAVKDAVFPLYSDESTEDAVAAIFDSLRELAGEDVAKAFLEQLPEVKRLIVTDVEAIAENDPAVTDVREIVFCYPALTAMLHYRTAHVLLGLGVEVLPRMLTEIAHSQTGIDIHPGAKIGAYFAIDHGTGVVIGATCVIGEHVMLYQGVTLGAKNFRYDECGRPIDTPRHPILEDNVTVYSNTSILGRVRIGHDTVIGGNVWLTHDVPANSRILQRKAVTEPHFIDGAGI